MLSVYAFLGMASTLILGWFADKANKPRMTAFILFAAAGAMFLPILGARSGRLLLLQFFLPRWRLLFRLAGPWSVTCSAESIMPRFAAIWSCFTPGEECSVR